MANPLFSILGGQGGGLPLPGPLGNMANFMSQFNQFRNSFAGDPKQQVQQMLNNGQMSQQQFNQLSQLATQIQKMMGGF